MKTGGGLTVMLLAHKLCQIDHIKKGLEGGTKWSKNLTHVTVEAALCDHFSTKRNW